MSGIPMNNESYNIDSVPPSTRPEHHLHDTSDRLPGAKGAAPTVDYSVGTVDRTPSSAWDDQPTTHRTDRGNHHSTTTHSSTTHHPTSHTGLDSAKPPMTRSDSAKGKTAFETERPLGVKPTPAGGVAIGGKDNLPEGKAGVGDKIVGKTQKVVGKYTHNMDLHEKGELREAGGKAAVTGQARAPHD